MQPDYLSHPPLELLDRPARTVWFVLAALTLSIATLRAADGTLPLQISWGHTSPQAKSFYLKLLTNDVSLRIVGADGFEAAHVLPDGGWRTEAGGGRTCTLHLIASFPAQSIAPITNLQRIWKDLIAQSDPDTARRLTQDPAYRPDTRVLTLQTEPNGTRGFSLTIDQLREQKAFWFPDFDTYIVAGANPPTFADHQRELARWKGQRILDRVQADPEARYEDFTARWADMGSPAYHNPAQTGPGHIICLSWDSTLHKFGVDRGAGVWNDYGNEDRFHCWFDFGDVSGDLTKSWKGQRLVQGLPIVQTMFETNGLSFAVEQFAFPLNGPPAKRDGEIPMVLLTRVNVTNPTPQTVSVTLGLHQRRILPTNAEPTLERERGDTHLVQTEHVLLAIQGDATGATLARVGAPEPDKAAPHGSAWRTCSIDLPIEIPSHSSKQVVLKLPSPLAPRESVSMLTSLDYSSAREATLAFWSQWLAQGAQFQVPEPAVNELSRANLWHALRLPRRHGKTGQDLKLDLPYSNFAYDQHGTPWPVNQAVYVDYMIYALRGYHRVATEELEQIFRNNQEPNGRVGGFANWGVYTPSMLYSLAKEFLLSGDEAAFNQLLPATLRALDWCEAEIAKGQTRTGRAAGLVLCPLNDGTGDGFWAFNQAYFYAGLELLGKALQELGHPRAQECSALAQSFRTSVEQAFSTACAVSPAVQLRDHTWIPYVPCEALSPHRLMQQWYPTDVDTGATHLLRLEALPATGVLSDWLLNDHEDNLYLHGWGMANEPVYNQQATAYLLRDDAKPAIRAFYSMMACAFSQSSFEPVEHRWTWGQYFGPPSTDGAWFELYRNMLVEERDHDVLILLQATPRRWLEPAKEINVERAPTYYGELSFHVWGGTASIEVDISNPQRRHPNLLLVRLRHPDGRPMRGVRVNEKPWTDFDPAQEWVRISDPAEIHYRIVASY